MPPPDLPALPAVTALARAEADAINAFAVHLTSPEGQGASDEELRLWLFERGWPPTKLRVWQERIAALVAVMDPEGTDPRLLLGRLNARLDRLAHRAEAVNDIKHAVEATKVQATLNRLGGYAPATATTSVTVNVTKGTAHLVSDDDLAAIAASAKPAVVDAVYTPGDPLSDPLLQ